MKEARKRANSIQEKHYPSSICSLHSWSNTELLCIHFSVIFSLLISNCFVSLSLLWCSLFIVYFFYFFGDDRTIASYTHAYHLPPNPPTLCHLHALVRILLCSFFFFFSFIPTFFLYVVNFEYLLVDFPLMFK